MRLAEGTSPACSLTSNILQQGRFNWLRVIFGKRGGGGGGEKKELLGAAGSLLMICNRRGLEWKKKAAFRFFFVFFLTCESLDFAAFDVRLLE